MDTTLGRLRHASLRDQARISLRASIVTGEFLPGELYSVASITSRLGVSATPVREALADLAHSGLVTVVRNRGFYVRQPTEHDLDEIFELRTMIEVPAIRRVAGQLTPQQVQDARWQVQRCMTGARSGDISTYLDADREFHLQLLRAFGNERLVETIDSLRDQVRLYGLTRVAVEGSLVASAQEHEQLLDAIEAGDTDAAESLMQRHLLQSRGTWADKATVAGVSSAPVPVARRAAVAGARRSA